MWCPDCVAVEALLCNTFKMIDTTSPEQPKPTSEGSSSSKPRAKIIYVGNKQAWKTPENEYRHLPYQLTAIPTVLKLDGDRIIARIVEDDILDTQKLAKFLKT